VEYIQGTAVEIQTPTDWNLPQHDGPATCVITQQYSSALFVSLRFSFRGSKKYSALLIWYYFNVYNDFLKFVSLKLRLEFLRGS
jgi:hypothetical protein